jgi:acyl dehydratase
VSRRSWGEVEVGEELPPLTFTLAREDLVRYAGASGDFNVIHWNERVAKSVGLPDVLAHGMLTMGQTLRIATDWAGDPGAIANVSVKFTRPVIVPDDARGAQVDVTATVGEKLDDNSVKIAITASFAGQSVLGRANAIVRLA